MSLAPEVIDALVASGVSAEQLAAAMKAALHKEASAKAERRARAAERQRKSRASRKASHDVTVTTRDMREQGVTSPSDGPFPPDTPLNPLNQPKTPLNPPRGAKTQDRFAEFWEAYPKRDGTNSRKHAAEKFARLVKAGTDPGEIILGARNYAAAMRSAGKEGTEFVKQTLAWLNAALWEQYAAQGPPAGEQVSTHESMLKARANMLKNPKNPTFAKDAANRYGEAELREMIAKGLLAVEDLQRIGVTIAPLPSANVVTLPALRRMGEV